MKLPQRFLLIVIVIGVVWVTLSVFKIHIDIEVVNDEEDHKKLHHKIGGDSKIMKRNEHPKFKPANPIDSDPQTLLGPYKGKSNLEPIYVPWSDYETPYKKDKEVELHESYRFNKYLSDRLPLNRDVEDTRPDTCKLQKYPKNMGKVSVVLISYNEAVSVVFRTIYSAINRSPAHLLHEFILYDDGSVWEESVGPMEVEAKRVKEVPVHFIRNATRGGLMRARTYAAEYATGDILVYLDSHCEVLPGWLEPLIEPIYKDPTAVTCPVIETIQWETMELHSGRGPMGSIGSFNILMNYNWYPIPAKEQERRKREHKQFWDISPIRSPAMAGGLFAINREYFHHLGEYDTQMNVWGGENTEISVRIWTCGGSLLFTPCSKVGHVFRHGYPYDFQGDHFDTVLFNYKRVAKVWFDDDEEFYYKLRPMARDRDVGSVSERKKLRSALQCKPYQWFVDNIAPNLVSERQLAHYGQMKSVHKPGFCVDNMGNENKGADLSVGNYPCHPADSAIDNQFVMLTKSGIFRTIDRCLTVNSRGVVAMSHCFDFHQPSFTWKYNNIDKTLVHTNSGRCLDFGSTELAPELSVVTCNGKDRQKWTFTYTNDS